MLNLIEVTIHFLEEDVVVLNVAFELYRTHDEVEGEVWLQGEIDHCQEDEAEEHWLPIQSCCNCLGSAFTGLR